MKVLLINGSPHQNGNTAIALTEVANQLSKENIDSEIIWIGNKPIRGCIACGQCKEQGLGQCIFDDDICNKISEKFKEVQALIVGSPVYYGQPNGALLSIIQRAFYSNGTNISGKPSASIAVCRRGGATAGRGCVGVDACVPADWALARRDGCRDLSARRGLGGAERLSGWRPGRTFRRRKPAFT